VSERLVCDPPELIEGRAELSLSSLGLEVREQGVDWGESQLEVQMARQAIGESVTNRHLNDVEVVIPLRVQAESGINLAEAAYKLQQKVGLWQAEGGWLRRDFDVGGKFAGSVGYRVKKADLSGLGGWLMAHRQSAPDVTLKLLRHPLCYATTEIEGAEVKGSEVRDLQWEISNVKGSAPGLMRLRVKNEGGTDWRGLIASVESRDLTAGSTAEAVYEAEKLTLKGGSTEAERTGASGKVVRSPALTSGWTAILGSEIAGVGHMTHKGTRNLRVRVYDPSASVGLVQLRLEWRALGAATWETNEIVSSPVVGGFQVISLGECRSQPAVLGLQRWEWKLAARAPAGSGSIDIDRIYPSAAEQITILSQSAADPIDGEPRNLPATAEDATGVGTVTWSEPTELNKTSESYVQGVLPKGATTHYLKATNPGFSIPTGSEIQLITVVVRRRGIGAGISDANVRIVKGGTVKTTVDRASSSLWPAAIKGSAWSTASYGGDLWGQTWTAADINSSGFGVALAAKNTGPEEGQALVNEMALIVAYSEGVNQNRVCFASRSMELRSDGSFRQAPSSEVWGQLVPDEGSFNLYAPPSGMESRAVRGIIIPSQGDLETRADAGANKISVKPTHRPGYLFAREAA
jgi:hypothetical protein